MQKSRTMTANQAAKLLGEDPSTTIRRIKANELPAEVIGDGPRPTYLVKSEDVAALAQTLIEKRAERNRKLADTANAAEAAAS